jgi:hypothetical protein
MPIDSLDDRILRDAEDGYSEVAAIVVPGNRQGAQPSCFIREENPLAPRRCGTGARLDRCQAEQVTGRLRLTSILHMVEVAMLGSMCRRRAQQELLFNRMIERCGVEVVEAVRLEQGEAYARAADACLLCPASGECAAWLDSGSPLAPTFCPNLAFFRRCSREQFG